MTSILTLEISGVKFELLIDGYDKNGIVINPKVHDLNDPVVFGVLQTVMSHHDNLFAFCRISDLISSWRMTDDNLTKYFENMTDVDVEQEIERIEKALNQEILTPSPEMMSYIEVARKQHHTNQERSERKKHKALRSEKNNRGWVYLLASPIYHKIGHTNDYVRRLAEFKREFPFPVQYECLIKTDNRYSLEAELHRHFASKRINREWFALTPVDVQYITSLAVRS